MSRRDKRVKKKKKLSFLGRLVVTFAALVVIFTAGFFIVDKYGFFGLFGGDIMDDVHAISGGDSDFSKEFPDSKRVNVLLLGTNHGLSDTIMLMSFDTALKRVDQISVPRDTYYERPDYPGAAYQKINSVYETEGVQGIADAVTDVLGGVPIHFYAEITDDGVAHVVDSMGGIDMDVPMDMDYEDLDQNLFIHLKAGQQTLSGDQAVQYLRFRKGYVTGDIGRVDAQQGFMKEAFKQSIGFGFPKVASTAIKELTTDIGKKMSVRLGTEAIGMKAEDFQSWTAPEDPNPVRQNNGASYYYVDRPAALEMMREIYSMKAEEK
ncbi:MAG: LCP family protein [Clostridiales Family XIII bacterium]|jgi:LCP family protein required for cell wall assembly|nr:LCP family protein [Clostridiales Family XIII bacterium]